MRFLALVSAVLPILTLVATVHGQADAGVGMIVAIDAAQRTLALDTRNGIRHVAVPNTASIRGERGEVLRFEDLGPGDAVFFQAVANAATRLAVARHFWAIPAQR